MNLNKVFLGGNITRDIETRTIGSGTTVASIGLAVNRSWSDQSGQKKEEVTFVDCEAWGKTAEVMAQYLGKGKPVFIEGRLKLDQWEDKDGGKRSKLKVVIDSFQFVGGKADGDSEPQRTVPKAKPTFKQPAKEMDADSIPW